MRLFVALPVAAEVRRALASAVEAARARDPGGDERWRWTRPEGWHVTVAFLGEVDEGAVAEVGTVVGAAAAGSGPIGLRPGEVGRLGGRVLHVALADDPPGAVADLGRRVQGALGAAGLPVQRREVRAHLTLARSRRRRGGAAPEVEVPEVAWRVEDAVLHRSRLGSGPARYEEVERLPLA